VVAEEVAVAVGTMVGGIGGVDTTTGNTITTFICLIEHNCCRRRRDDDRDRPRRDERDRDRDRDRDRSRDRHRGDRDRDRGDRARRSRSRSPQRYSRDERDKQHSGAAPREDHK
jgi:hypothetical protein